MAFPKGRKNPNAGRKKGGANRNKYLVRELLEEKGCDPIEGLIEISRRAMSEADYKLAGDMFKELAKYSYPQLKSIELSGDSENPVEMVFKWENE